MNSRPIVSGRGSNPGYVVPTPPPPNTTPTGAPVLSSISATNITDTSAIIRWNVDQYATGQVNYGATASYGSNTTAESSYNYNQHAQTISGLSQGTTYHYRVRSTNAAAQETVSGDNTFTTIIPELDFDTGMTYTNYTPPLDITTLSALQTWFNSVPNGSSSTVHSRVLLGAGRTYTGATGIQLAGRTHITFEGGGTETSGTSGAVTYGGQTGGAQFVLTGSPSSTGSSGFRSASGAGSPANDIRFHGMHIEGSSTNYASVTAGDGGEYQMSWCFYGAQNILIDHCTANRCKGDGIYMAGTTFGRLDNWCQNITMRYSTISNNGRMGLGVIAVNGLTVQHCRFTDICYAILDLEPNYGNEGASNVICSDNLIDGSYFSWDDTFTDGAFITATASPKAANDGSTTAVFSGYIKVERNRLLCGPNPTVTGTDVAYTSGNFYAVFRFQYPNVASKTAILTIKDNVSTVTKRGYIAYISGWPTNGHEYSNNTGFWNSTGPGLLFNGSNGTFVSTSGNT